MGAEDRVDRSRRVWRVEHETLVLPDNQGLATESRRNGRSRDPQVDRRVLAGARHRLRIAYRNTATVHPLRHDLMGYQLARVIQDAMGPRDDILAVRRAACNVRGLAVHIGRCRDRANGPHLNERADARGFVFNSTSLSFF